MAKSLPQIAREYAENNPNVSIELAFLEGMLYQAKQGNAKIEQRKEKFRKELSFFTDKYSPYMIESFFDYWSEMNKSGTKMRFENEKTWELSKRLARWANNNYDRYPKSSLQLGQIINDKQSEEILFKANF